MYLAPFSFSNGVSLFLLRLLRCQPVARKQCGQQWLYDLLQLYFLSPCPWNCTRMAAPQGQQGAPTSPITPLSLCSGWPGTLLLERLLCSAETLGGVGGPWPKRTWNPWVRSTEGCPLQELVSLHSGKDTSVFQPSGKLLKNQPSTSKGL